MLEFVFVIRSFIAILILTMVSVFSVNADVIEDLKKQIKQSTDSVQFLQFQAKLAHLYNYRNLDSMGSVAKEAISLSQRIKHKPSEGQALSALAIYFFEKGNSFLGYKYANEAMRLFNSIKYFDQELEVKAIISSMMLFEQNIQQSKQNFAEILKQLDKVKSDSIRTHIKIIYYLNHITDSTIANKLEIFKSLRNDARKYNFAYLDELFDQNLIAFKHFEKQISDDEFEKQYIEIIPRLEKARLNRLTILSLFNIGFVLHKKSPERAIEAVLMAIDMAKKEGYEALEFLGLQQVSYILDLDPTKKELANEYKTRMLEMSRARVVKNRDEGFDIYQFAEQKTQLENQELKIEKRKIWMIGLGVTLTIILIVLVFIYLQYSTKRKLAHRLKVINLELEKKNRRLEENDNFHKMLIAMMSHDLRLPFSQILMLDEQGIRNLEPDALQLFMYEIRQSAEVSLQTIDGLLNWMKEQMDPNGASKTTIPLRESFKKAIEFSEYLRKRKNVEVILDIPIDAGVKASSEILLFINRNILLNAVFHSPNNSNIHVKAQIQEDLNRIVVQISDQGKGLTDVALNTLFRKVQERPSGNNTRGAGISMMISNEMIDVMGGKIWAKNNVDKGASFYYSLPYVQILN